LFGEVLPSHSAVESISLVGDLPAPRLELFTTAGHAAGASGAPRTSLTLGGSRADREQARAISHMLRRNLPISHLTLFPRLPRFDAESCAVLGQSASRASSLRLFHIRGADFPDGALDSLVASASLRHLGVTTVRRFRNEAVASIAMQLRTNTTLIDLSLERDGPEETGQPSLGEEGAELFRPLASVLETYNFTLTTVELGMALAETAVVATIRELLHRNRPIQAALEQLAPRNYHVAPTCLWPTALGRVSRFPTLLYRILRRGDVNEVGDRLGRRIGGQTRGRATAGEEEEEEE
jgi:hypothetical protein